MPELPWIDWAMLAVLLVSVIVGIVRGFVFEVMSLVGWVVAWFGSQWLVADVAPLIPLGEADSGLRRIAAYVAGFVAILLVWSLGARLVRLLLHATPLSLPDRLLGAGFGLLRGAVVLLAVATIVMLSPAAQSKPWQRSEGARWLGVAMLGIKPLLPPDWARHIPEPGS